MHALRHLAVCSGILLSSLLTSSPPGVLGQVRAAEHSTTPSPVYLIIRSEDAGMSHSVNLALKKLIESGLPLSVSVMFPTPWYQETVAILKPHPQVAVGIHLTLNSEWKYYSWGPELAALEDMNTDHPLPEMSKNRQGELDALTSNRFTEALKARNVQLLTYRELIAKEGLKAMRRPAG